MRESREYVSRYRYGKKVAKMLKAGTICQVCSEVPAQKLHHKNEDHNDNRDANLKPVCRECHLDIPHESDKRLPMAISTAIVPAQELVLDTKEPQGKDRASSIFSKSYTLVCKSKKLIELRCYTSLRIKVFLEGLGYEEKPCLR